MTTRPMIPAPSGWARLRLKVMWAWSVLTDPPLNLLTSLPSRLLGPRR
jgi:hypothetical protein